MKRFLITIFLSAVSLPPSTTVAQESAAPLSYSEYYKLASSIDIEAHRVSIEKFLAMREMEGTIVLDLRDHEAFMESHIEGALHLGSDITAEKLAELIPDQETTILIYCTNSLVTSRMLSLTTIALPQILTLGYANTFLLEDTFMNGGTTLIQMTQGR